MSGELPYYLAQSLEVMIYGLSIALIVGIPLGIAIARIRWKSSWIGPRRTPSTYSTRAGVAFRLNAAVCPSPATDARMNA